jgi:hypothetical protein
VPVDLGQKENPAPIKFRPMSTDAVQRLVATWPKPLTILATRLAALPIDDAKASTRSPYAAQSFLLAVDALKGNLSAVKALQVIVYEMEYRPDCRELLYLVDRALDVRWELARLRGYGYRVPTPGLATILATSGLTKTRAPYLCASTTPKARRSGPF